MKCLTAFFISVAIALCLAVSASRAVALEFKGVEAHGSLSVTSAFSDKYNYLGDTSRRFDVNVIEGIANARYQFDMGIQAAVQVYAYQLDDYTAVELDYGNLSYAFKDWFGLSIGRIKRRHGLYWEMQDIDVLHPFAFLPITNLRKDMRPLFASFDGIQASGRIGLQKAGSLEYNLYAAIGRDVDPESYFGRTWSTMGRMDSLDTGFSYGGSLFYNAPLEGLRVGISAAILPNVKTTERIRKKSELRYQSIERRFAADQADKQFVDAFSSVGLPPEMIDLLYGENYSLWDATFAGREHASDVAVTALKLSAEYRKGPLLLALEYSRMTYDIETSGVFSTSTSTAEDDIFAMAAWKATPKLELGVYADFAWQNKDDRSGRERTSLPGHTAYTRDYAIAASYNINDWWRLKAEYHLIDGTSLISNFGKENGNPRDWSGTWSYIVLKTTFSF